MVQPVVHAVKALGAGCEERHATLDASDHEARHSHPLRAARLRRSWPAYTVNELGNWVGEIALAVLVFDQTGSPLATAALFLGMQFLPAFFSQALVARAEPTGTRSCCPLLYLGEAALFLALALSAEQLLAAARGGARDARRHAGDRGARVHTRVGRGGPDSGRAAAPGQRHHQHRLHRRGGARPGARRPRRRRPRRARPRCCWTPRRSCAVAAMLALARSLPQVKAEARARGRAACVRARLRAPEPRRWRRCSRPRRSRSSSSPR